MRHLRITLQFKRSRFEEGDGFSSPSLYEDSRLWANHTIHRLPSGLLNDAGVDASSVDKRRIP
jgi:hypothetical protein